MESKGVDQMAKIKPVRQGKARASEGAAKGSGLSDQGGSAAPVRNASRQTRRLAGNRNASRQTRRLANNRNHSLARF